MPLAGIGAFFDPKKCYLSQRQHFSGQNPLFVGRCRPCGGRRPLFTLRLEFQSKTGITIRFGASPALGPPVWGGDDGDDKPGKVMTLLSTSRKRQETLGVTGVTRGAGRSY